MLEMTGHARAYPHHAPMLYALIAAAYHAATGHESAIPDGVMLDAPEQARTELRPGEPYALGWTIVAPDGAAAARTTDALLNGLAALGSKKAQNAKVLGGNFVVRSVEDLVGGANRKPRSTAPLTCIPGDHIRREFERLNTPRRMVLRFSSPLRVERGDAFKQEGRRYFDDRHFEPPRFIQRVRHRLSGLDLWPTPTQDWPNEVVLLENNLVWLDLGYGGKDGKTLGGAMGRVVIDCPRTDLIAALVLGQYGRVGLSTRFGFGAYRIEELGPEPFACARSRPLLAAAMSSHELQLAADELDLPSGAVRKLAERSQLAAEEINSLSTSSVSIADKSGRLLEQIVPNIQNTSKLVQEIAASSREQNSGAEQVNTSIQQFNTVIQQSAAGAEEIASSSEELSSQADHLREAISFFKIDKHQRTPVADGNGKARKAAFSTQQKSKNGVLAKATSGKGALIDLEKGDGGDSNFEKFN